jgi:hypothetical protein
MHLQKWIALIILYFSALFDRLLWQKDLTIKNLLPKISFRVLSESLHASHFRLGTSP